MASASFLAFLVVKMYSYPGYGTRSSGNAVLNSPVSTKRRLTRGSGTVLNNKLLSTQRVLSMCFRAHASAPASSTFFIETWMKL